MDSTGTKARNAPVYVDGGTMSVSCRAICNFLIQLEIIATERRTFRFCVPGVRSVTSGRSGARLSRRAGACAPSAQGTRQQRYNLSLRAPRRRDLPRRVSA